MSEYQYEIKPKVDEQAAGKAKTKLTQIVDAAAAAVKAGNQEVLRELNVQAAKELKQQNPKIDVTVDLELNSATGQIREVKKYAASALDPFLKDYQRMIDIQGRSALTIKKEIQLQKENLAGLKRKGKAIKKISAEFLKNAFAQKKVVDQTKKLEKTLIKVSTMASLKGQQREAAQRLSMMSQTNLKMNEQGQLVTVANQEYAKQLQVVNGLNAAIKKKSFQTMTFSSKVATAGKAMQAAFGWIAAAVGAFAALTAAIGAITGRVKDVQALKLSFDGLGQSVDAQNAILGSAKNIALSYGVSLRKVEGAYRRLGPAILESGGSLKQTEGAIKSISARTTMLGLNTEQTGRYIEAFAQVMGKGKLQGEELNQQFAELDGGLRGQLKNWLAANKGITDFEKAMQNGEITSGVFLEAFQGINEEIRIKFLRSIGDTQVAIETLGERGGLTLNQLNAQLQTLTSIGLEGLGKALAPLGKELIKVYAAFVQMFTKIHTEMPGAQALFRALGHVIGVVVKVSLNTVILLLGAMMKMINNMVLLVTKLYEKLRNIPAFDRLFDSLGKAGKGMNKFFDGMIDGFTKLSDETIGAKTELDKFADELKMLKDMQAKGEIDKEEYERKLQNLEDRRLQAKKKSLDKELEAEKATLDEMIQMRNDEIARAEQLAEREIEQIENLRDKEISRHDAAIALIEKKAAATAKAFEAEMTALKAGFTARKRAIEDEMVQVKSRQTALKREFKDRESAAKEYYAGLKREMDAAHSKEMAQIDSRLAKMKAGQQSELAELDNGPAKQRLEQEKMRDLQRQISQEKDKMKRLELQAELESMQNAKKKAELEKQFAKELAAEEKRKAELQKEQAAEKKRLQEEERARLQEINDAERQAMRDIADLLAALAEKKRQISREEQDAIAALKQKQKEADDEAKQDVEEIERKKEEANAKAKREIDEINAKILDQKRLLEDVKAKIVEQANAYNSVGKAVDKVTNGALDRQLDKVLRIKRELNSVNSKAASNARRQSRFAGGPVSGGTTYTVNELGKEGFLSASGKIGEIKAPAFGDWKAPSRGTVIPAHIWKILNNSENSINFKAPTSPNPTASSAIPSRAQKNLNNSQSPASISLPAFGRWETPSGAATIPAHIWKTLKSSQGLNNINIPASTNPGNGVARAISTISSISNGDSFTNNVTVQAVNPVQAANNMMVEMTRLKRRRLR